MVSRWLVPRTNKKVGLLVTKSFKTWILPATQGSLVEDSSLLGPREKAV